MSVDDQSLSSLDIHKEQDVKLARNLLKDLAADALRDYISTGRIPEGTKLTEREVSQLLGISRMPVHDALIILETEGLVVRRGNARYVIKLEKKNVCDLYAIRHALEIEAVAAAIRNLNEEHEAALWAKFNALKQARATGDMHLSARRDIDLHQLIWQLADNTYLLDILNSLIGVIFVLNDRNQSYTQTYERDPVEEHRELIEYIIAGDIERAQKAMELHLTNALRGTLDTFREVDKVSIIADSCSS